MASKTEKTLKKEHRRHRPLSIESKAKIIKRPKDDKMSPGKLRAVAEWVVCK